MKVYVVREIYGSMLGVYDTAKKADEKLDELYSMYSSEDISQGFVDLEDWGVEEWEVE